MITRQCEIILYLTLFPCPGQWPLSNHNTHGWCRPSPENYWNFYSHLIIFALLRICYRMIRVWSHQQICYLFYLLLQENLCPPHLWCLQKRVFGFDIKFINNYLPKLGGRKTARRNRNDMSDWWMMIFKEYVKTVSGVWNCEILLYQILYYQIN